MSWGATCSFTKVTRLPRATWMSDGVTWPFALMVIVVVATGVGVGTGAVGEGGGRGVGMGGPLGLPPHPAVMATNAAIASFRNRVFISGAIRGATGCARIVRRGRHDRADLAPRPPSP